MKFVFSYFRENFKWLISNGICILIMCIIMISNDIALSELTYGVAIAIFFLLVIMGCDLAVYIRKQVRLLKMDTYLENIMEYLEEPKSAEEVDNAEEQDELFRIEQYVEMALHC